MQKVLIILDKFGWSYDTIAKGLVKHNTHSRLSLDIVSVKSDFDYIAQNHGRYDLVFALGWTLVISKKEQEDYRALLPFLDRSKLIAGIHSHRSWDGYVSLPESNPPPPAALLNQLSGLKSINIISRRLYKIFKDAGLKNIVLTENGVDTDLFAPSRPVNTDRKFPLILGFSGSTSIPKHDRLRGFSEFILPLSQIPNVAVRALGGRGEGNFSGSPAPSSAWPTIAMSHFRRAGSATAARFIWPLENPCWCSPRALKTIFRREKGCADLSHDGRGRCRH